MKLVICVLLSIYATSIVYNVGWIIENIPIPGGALLLFVTGFVAICFVFVNVGDEVMQNWK